MSWNPTYKVDLIALLDSSFDSDIADALRSTVKESDFKTLFGQRVVDEIVTRTREQGIDKNGKSMGKYSTTYKNSLIFQIYKDSGKVNLTLTGDMLDSMYSRNGRTDIIVYLEGDLNRAKAQGHITGMYGKKGRTKPRDFLGLPKNVEKKLFRESIKDYRNLSKLTVAELSLSL